MSGTFRTAVLGDSVPWGQGLAEPSKFSTRLVEALAGERAREIIMPAHSGAVIVDEVPGVQSAAHREVPVAEPTIIAQIAHVPRPDEIELVLLNGGINDVSIWRILDPLTSTHELRHWTRLACYTRMKQLLAAAVSTFTHPQARLVVTGYYPILSPDSDILSGGGNLGNLLGNFGLGIPVYLSHPWVISHIVDQAMLFWRESESHLARAVHETRLAIPAAARLVYVPSPYREQNSLFASNPWLFGFAADLKPEDEVVGERATACRVHFNQPNQRLLRETCRYASVGHPNRAGATAYTHAVLQALAG